MHSNNALIWHYYKVHSKDELKTLDIDYTHLSQQKKYTKWRRFVAEDKAEELQHARNAQHQEDNDGWLENFFIERCSQAFDELGVSGHRGRDIINILDNKTACHELRSQLFDKLQEDEPDRRQYDVGHDPGHHAELISDVSFTRLQRFFSLFDLDKDFEVVSQDNYIN